MSAEETLQTQEAAPIQRRGRELRRRPEVFVGGLPTVSLLPSEFRDAARGRSIRRAFVGGVLAAVLIAGAATAGAVSLAAGAQSRVDSATTDAQALSAQVAKFKDVQTLQQSIAVGDAAVKVGSSTEIDWQAQIQAIEAEMPSGYRVTGISGDSASAVEAYQQGSSPLELPRAASVQLTVTTSNITTLPPWLRKLRSIPAYADATASVTADEPGSYTVLLAIHLSPKALVHTGKAAR